MRIVTRILLLCLAAVVMTAGSLQAKTLTVACDTNFMPFEFKKDGEYVGFDIDIWDTIAQDLGLDYKLQPMDFNGIIPALQTGNVDAAIAAITIKSTREEVVDFSHPYYDAGLRVIVSADNNSIKGLSDLDDKIVATKIGTTSADYARENMDAKDVKLFPNIDAAYMELRTGGADAVLFDAPAVMYYANTAGKGAVKVVGPLYQGQSYGIAFPQGSDLREKVNIALLKMIESGEYAEIYEKWFGSKPQ
ncbi:glutamine ABC transporter substrate-binding protein GlnH [Desulfohalobium retbaense]|uniref:Extracellular solute-binding protein family 3 n=1 Tax=Desulfohalobium retbaense (strain ATCC 49708 / DSM 5692 / JCM 16813 / HR100) TaxID=485915 RepID=C8X258_DESRD|nr:glutamine ABC transporter substrate-binding protein GlnH [Desulfohalobium retbaense]ACV68381.1 extracellular solute-binding protein family 3 [Desulfohalobium retbaense DSM 5692]